MDYRIPWAPPDITSGAKLLLGVLQNNREQDRADYNTQINATNANNAFVRESAQTQRESADFQNRMDEKRRERAIQDAQALETIKDHIRRGDVGIAQALGKAHGIDVHEAAKQAGQEDGAKQAAQLPTLLQAALPVQPEAAPAPAGPVSAEPGNGLQAMDQAQSQYVGAPLHTGEEGPLEPGDERMAASGPAMAEQAPPANVVKINEPFAINADVPTPPMPPTPEAAPSAVSAPPQMAAATVPPRQNPLFEAVMGGQTYPLGGQGKEGTGLGPKYDAIYERASQEPGGDKVAFAKVLAMFEKDQHDALLEGGRNQRSSENLTSRDTHQLTADQKQANFDARLAMSERVARIHAAATGNTATPAAVAHLVGMKEAGASDEEIFAEAAKAHVPEKQFVQPVQNVTRNATAAERAGQKREALVATDDTGKTLGTWKDAQAAKTGEKQIVAFHRVKERLADLIADIKSTGSRTDLNADQIQQRISKGQAVVAALRPFNELSNTAAGAKMESDILGALGAPGHGWLWGANLGIVDRLAKEAEGQHQAQLNAYLRPGGGSSLAPALGGPKRGGAAHPAEESVGATRNVGDVTYRKVGPNNWQPVTQ